MSGSKARMALLAAAVALVSIIGAAATTDFLPRTRPYVIGHRGACGYRPEHTLASYALAAEFGADFVECDVVLTKDLVPICRHEPLLSGTTDSDIKFPELIRTIEIDGANYTGVFSTDLTLAQVKTLRAKERLPDRDQSFNGLFEVPTLEEQIKFVQGYYRPLGIYPETKHPTWHDSLPQVQAAGTSISQILLETLTKYHYTGPLNSCNWSKRPVFIQSFEAQNLKKLAKLTTIPLVQLTDDFTVQVPGEMPGVTYAKLLTGAGIAQIASYASGLGPWKQTLLVLPNGTTYSKPNGASLVSTGIVALAHANGLQVHPYTWRKEAGYLTYGNWSSIDAEYDRYYVGEGLDGLFTDFADTAINYIHKKNAREAGRRWNTELLNKGYY